MKSLVRLWPDLVRHWRPFAVGIVLLLAARVFEAVIPLLLKHGIDGMVDGTAQLAAPALGIGGCVVGRFLCIIVGRRAVRLLGVEVAWDLRRRFYQHVQRQGPVFLGQHPIGDLMARAINDIQMIRRVIAQGTRTVLVLFFSASVGFAFMVRESPWLTMWLLPPLPVIAVTAYVLSRRIFARSMAVQEGFSDLSDRVQENLNGIRTVQAQCQEDEEIRRFDAVNANYERRYVDLVTSNSLINAFMPALGSACTLVILGIGGQAVLDGRITVGTFAAFFWFLGMVLWPVREAGNMVNLFQRGSASTERLFEVLDAVPESRDRADDPPASLASVKGEIEIRDLDFRHSGAAHSALRGISLSIAPGETVAFLGRVGAGKSTLLHLLVRWLEPPRGQIFLDGRDVLDLPLRELRRDVALVAQAPFLFADTLGSNVAYDDPARSDHEIWGALETSAMANTARQLGEGIETLIGERGVTLSGGQKQRSTLARGVIRDAPVLLLDDCFSSVDTETEEHILRELLDARKGRTTLLVSHRVSTVKRADRIYVLESGGVVEHGSHRELVARGGRYAALEVAQGRRGRLLGELGEEASP